MRILVLNSDYPRFLAGHYSRTPELAFASYQDQMEARNATLFSVADFYSRNFVAHGHVSQDVHVNNSPMQFAWARAKGMNVPEPPAVVEAADESNLISQLKRRLRRYKPLLAPIAKKLGLLRQLDNTQRSILLAQVEEFRPDVILNQEIETVDGSLIRQMSQKNRIIVAQCGVDPPRDVSLTHYDLGISPIDWVADYFRGKGLRAATVPLAFEPSVLDRLGPAPARDIAVSFVGGLSSDHRNRIALLEAIAARYPLDIWVPDIRALGGSSPLRNCYRGEAWGRDMYNVLRRSRITLNAHINAARGQASNLRLYEATGVGTFQLTDGQLGSLFTADIHLCQYASVDDVLDKIGQYLANDDRREAIARAGQAHTLSVHNFYDRTRRILAAIGAPHT